MNRPLIKRLLHNLVEASSDQFRYLSLGDQLKPWELHPLVSDTSKVNLKVYNICSPDPTEETLLSMPS